MRRSIVYLITMREVRDLLRDRRTLFLILGLPVLLYPLFGLVGFLFALSTLEQKVVVGVVGIEHLPVAKEHPESLVGGGVLAAEAMRKWDDPPLIVNGEFAPGWLSESNQPGTLVIVPLPSADKTHLDQRRCDVIVEIPPQLIDSIARQQYPDVKIHGRKDEVSKLAIRRVEAILNRWNHHYKEVRFARKGLPHHYDQPVHLRTPSEGEPIAAKAADELRDILVKFIPFLLVMWTMAGALHPAVDLTAGEKERGTMETLLISPANRSEIVAGKFLAIGFFSYGSALWNVLWMGGGAVVLGAFLPYPILSLGGLAWAMVFAFPLAMMFSAVAIGLGVFARSTKEGQYYLLPLFLVVMPLTLWSMTPGLKLSWWTALVPVTGLSLILQQLISVSGDVVPLVYWLLVFGSLTIWMLLSLWWAARQFRRESVLFREAERIRVSGRWFGWFRRKSS